MLSCMFWSSHAFPLHPRPISLNHGPGLAQGSFNISIPGAARKRRCRQTTLLHPATTLPLSAKHQARACSCPSGEGSGDLQIWRRRTGGRSWDAAEVLKTGGERAGSQQHLPLQSPSWKKVPLKTQLPTTENEFSERRNPNYNLLHSPLAL